MIRPDTDSIDTSGLADLFALGIATAASEGDERGLADALPSRLLTQDLSDRSRSNEALQAAIVDGYDPVLWLGKGGGCEAWRCIDRSFGREVAIKVMRPERARHPEEAEALLQREAEVLGKLNHPGIVHALRRAGAGNAAYLVLDFVDGDDLLSHCRLCQLGVQDRLRLFGRVVEAVAYLHGKGVVHGDLKPEHLLVPEDGHPVLIDFGLAAQSEDASRIARAKGHIGGSGRYRAPEIVEGTASRSMPHHDIFAMGEILRVLIAEHGDDAGALQEPLDAIIKRATSTDPDERWQDAGAFQIALRDVLTTRQPASESASDTASAVTAKPRLSPPSLLLIAAALALLACGSTAWLVGGRPTPGQTDAQGKTQRVPLGLTAQAGLLEGVAAHTYRGETQQAEAALEAALATQPDATEAWEVRHLQAGIDGQPFTQPYGAAPYDDPFALTTGFDPVSRSIAYVVTGDNGFEVWVRAVDKDPIHVTTTKHVILAVALSPNVQQVATIEGEGQVVLRSVRPDAAEGDPSHRLPRDPDARGLWYSRDGEALYVFSPAARTVEHWATADAESVEPEHTFEECDHAYLLPSGEGGFILATRGTHTESGRTRLRHLDAEEQKLRAFDLKDDHLPVSADATPTEDGLACFGMSNGYVRIYDPANSGWQPPCDLGVNNAVPAILYVEAEGRIFAGCSRVFAIDTNGLLMMRLGDRDASQQLLTGLRYDATSGSVVSFGHQRIQRWNAPPATE